MNARSSSSPARVAWGLLVLAALVSGHQARASLQPYRCPPPFSRPRSSERVWRVCPEQDICAKICVELGGIESISTVLASASESQIVALSWFFVKSACWPVLPSAALFYRVG